MRMLKWVTATAVASVSVVSGAFGQSALDQLDSDIGAEKFKKITSVLIAESGEITYENYWDEGGPDYLNDARSATKSLTAMAIGAAIMDGHIKNVDERAYKWFRKERPFRFSTELKRDITIRDLLTMSSALDCNDGDSSTPGYEDHMHPARVWLYFVLDLPTRDDYVRDAAGLGPFNYCTAGTFLLGQIIEKATGEKVDKYIERRLLSPLGIDKVEWFRSPSGEVQTGGGTRLTSRAFVTLAEMVRNDGVAGNDRLLPKGWADEMHTAHRKVNNMRDYGYLWWRQGFSCGDKMVDGWIMAGNGGNKIVVIDELDMTVAVTARLYNTQGMHQQSDDIINHYVLASQPRCLKG